MELRSSARLRNVMGIVSHFIISCHGAMASHSVAITASSRAATQNVGFPWVQYGSARKRCAIGYSSFRRSIQLEHGYLGPSRAACCTEYIFCRLDCVDGFLHFGLRPIVEVRMTTTFSPISPRYCGQCLLFMGQCDLCESGNCTCGSRCGQPIQQHIMKASSDSLVAVIFDIYGLSF